ncbi:MAG: globin [Akkermansiaceae bacterium]|mgnify:CR=1 FL=1
MASRVTEEQIYTAIGDDGFTRLCANFYRQVKVDDLIGPMYPDNDWEGSEERLRDFLLFRFAANPTYLEKRGHPRLRGRHMPFRIGMAERDRWMEMMGKAVEEEISDENARAAMITFFAQVADFMRNVPDELR